jgi:hypothetical protein
VIPDTSAKNHLHGHGEHPHSRRRSRRRPADSTSASANGQATAAVKEQRKASSPDWYDGVRQVDLETAVDPSKLTGRSAEQVDES